MLAEHLNSTWDNRLRSKDLVKRYYISLKVDDGFLIDFIKDRDISKVNPINVQASEISKIKISYPDPETQIRIIKILEAIRNRIESCENELNHLTKMRSSLLQQLFI